MNLWRTLNSVSSTNYKILAQTMILSMSLYYYILIFPACKEGECAGRWLESGSDSKYIKHLDSTLDYAIFKKDLITMGRPQSRAANMYTSKPFPSISQTSGIKRNKQTKKHNHYTNNNNNTYFVHYVPGTMSNALLGFFPHLILIISLRQITIPIYRQRSSRSEETENFPRSPS